MRQYPWTTTCSYSAILIVNIIAPMQVSVFIVRDWRRSFLAIHRSQIYQMILWNKSAWQNQYLLCWKWVNWISKSAHIRWNASIFGKSSLMALISTLRLLETRRSVQKRNRSSSIIFGKRKINFQSSSLHSNANNAKNRDRITLGSCWRRKRGKIDAPNKE